jgi:FMN reductase [NAD(P)H]
MTNDDPYPNETIRLLCERASCRNFAERDIPADVLDQVLEAGIHAPTAGNLQPYSIIKIANKDSARKLAELAGGQSFVADAPINLLFCLDWNRLRRWAELEVAPFTATSSFRHFWLSFQDVIIAAQNICTAADALGLGSVYVGTIIDTFAEIRVLCELPEEVMPVVLLCLGYPASKPPVARKLGIDVCVHDEKYREPDDRELLDAFDAKYPGRHRQATDDRVQEIADVCREVHGREFAERCVAKIRENGYISPVQTYFGLHYCASTMPLGNQRYLDAIEEFGFAWFKKFMPRGD